MARYFGMEFAPFWQTTLERRLQTLAVIWGLSLLLFNPIIMSFLFVMVAWYGYWSLFLGYILWWFWDVFFLRVQQRGGRRSKWLRNSWLAHNLKNYFPVELVKTTTLDPEHNYIVGVHPHGIVGCGAMVCFGTDAAGFPSKFPGITPYLLTLKINFWWPIARAYFLWLGRYTFFELYL